VNRPFYAFARGLCAVVCRVVWRYRASGRQHVPPDGALIVACNHVSYLDPVLLGVALPRPVTYLAKKELFAIPVLGPVIAALGAYPTDRGAGGTAALRAAVRVLKKGRCVGIFPEGTRNLDGNAKEKGGAAMLAVLTGAPVVPAAVAGTKDARRLEQFRVAFGEPYLVPADRSEGGIERATAEIMRRIRDLEAQLAR
jgi:1-acyl-sn-glycerol-3-phosphate acyltransferase